MSQKIGQLIRRSYSKFERWRKYANSRNQAKKIRDDVIKKKGYSCVTDDVRIKIKDYAKERFGDTGYSAWLELYAELREEFIEGWIPEDYYSIEMIPQMNPRNIADISNLKTFDHRIFKEFAIEPLAVKINGRFYDYNQRPLDKNQLLELLRDYGDEVVIKKDLAPSGKDIIFKHSDNVTVQDFTGNQGYIIQPSVKQHKILKELHGASVNTLRITTFFEPSGTISVKHISLRFGIEGIRLSNIGAGGLFVFLDNNGTVISNAYNGVGLESGDVHPDSGLKYKELQIPSVKEAVSKCRAAHHQFPYLRFIAWDVYIDREGKPGLIEWNAWMPGIWENEALIGPLWPEWKV